MARAPHGSRWRVGGAGRRDAAAGSGEPVRKGTWEPNEDAVLQEHVRTHGPRDWSSIRSKGLLPRTGKSCRLRWVNKLRPNLKSGCKFTAEEERTVLDLQAKVGNKWATIAKELPGRTDNDVKNFWSSRRKRLARLQGTPLPGRSSRNRSANAAVASSLESQRPVGPSLDFGPFMSSSSGHSRAATPFKDAQNLALVPYHQTSSQLLGFEGAQLPAGATDTPASSSNSAPLPGRMDDDLINYRNSCEKGLARLQRRPLRGWCSSKEAASSSLQSRPPVGPFLGQVPFEGSSSSDHFCAGTPFVDAQNSALVPHDPTGSQPLGFEGGLLPIVPATDSQAISSKLTPLAPELPFYQPPYPLLDFPGMTESGGITTGFVNASVIYDQACQELLQPTQPAPMIHPFFMHDGVKPELQGVPNDFFGDLPPDLFDATLPPATSPSPSSSRTISDL